MLGKRPAPDGTAQQVAASVRAPPVVINASAIIARESQLHRLSREALREKMNSRSGKHTPNPSWGGASGALNSALSNVGLAPLTFDSADRDAFLQTARSVEELGATMLAKKDKKAYQAKQLQGIGVEKVALRTPIKVLNGMKSKNDARDAKQRDLDVAAGNLVRKKPRIEPVERKVSIFPSERAQLSTARKKSSFRRETRVTSSGALFVSRHDLREVGRSSGRAPMSLAKHFGRK